MAGDASVTSEATLVAMYRRIGQQNSSMPTSRWETIAAQQAGTQVRRELVATPAAMAMARASGDGENEV